LNAALPLKKEKSNKSQPAEGTLGALTFDYKTSPEFRDRAARTKKDYLKIFDWLADIADTSLERFSPEFIYNSPLTKSDLVDSV
jgi:hypothetical protein